MHGSRGGHSNRIVVSVFFLVLIVDLMGCSRSLSEQPAGQTPLAPDVAPGIILIDVLESGHPEHYRQYEVRPTTGSVRNTKEQDFHDNTDEDIPHVFSQPAGAIATCTRKPEASSIDGNYLAYCTRSGSDEFFVVDKKTSEMSYHWKPDSWRGINGFAWAPNSHSVAFLNISEYYGKSPLEFLSSLVGHPVPHDTIYLDVLDVHAGKLTEYVVRRNVISAFTRILNWSE